MNRYKIKLSIQLLLIVLSAAGVMWGILRGPLYMAILLSLVILILMRWIIYSQTRIHEHINYFFEAILNDDFSFRQKMAKKDEILILMNENMDLVNQKIKKNIEENQQQEVYFRALLDHLNIGVLTFDPRGFIVHANKTLLNYFGIDNLSHIKQLGRYDEKLMEMVSQMQAVQTQHVFSFTNHTRKYNLLLKSTYYINNDEAMTIITIQDIDQQLNEKELDSWIKLIRVLTHEIMNGIAPVTSLSESILTMFTRKQDNGETHTLKPSDIDIAVKGLNVINEQADRLTRFVESFRKITRLPQPVKKPISLKLFLEKIILLSKAGSYGTNVDIKLEMADAQIEVNADEKQITQVLLNILKNSFEALEDTVNPAIEVRIASAGSGITEISISNNGPEIPQEIINDIFVPFFTTKNSGSGVGLSLSRQIMRLHGGTLKVSSNPEKTTFVIGLPG